jgi:hypothetical protein
MVPVLCCLTQASSYCCHHRDTQGTRCRSSIIETRRKTLSLRRPHAAAATYSLSHPCLLAGVRWRRLFTVHSPFGIMCEGLMKNSNDNIIEIRKEYIVTLSSPFGIMCEGLMINRNDNSD